MAKGKKKLRIRAGAIYMHELDGMTFGGVMDYLTNYGDTIEEEQGLTDCILVDGDDGSRYFAVYGFRLETDEEFKKRIKDNERAEILRKARAKELAKEKEEREKKEYERLKKKFKEK